MITLPNQNKTILLSYISLGLVLALFGGLLHYVASPIVLVEYLKYAVVLLFLVNIGTSVLVKKLPLYHPYVMFLGMFGLFILSRIFLDVFSISGFQHTTQFSSYDFRVEIQEKLLLNVLLSLWSLQLGVLIFELIPDKESDTQVPYSVDWCNIGLFFFYIGLPFFIYQSIQLGTEVLEKGYAARFSGALQYRNTYLTTFLYRSSFCGFFIYLAGVPKSKFFYLHLFVFVIALYTMLLGGVRYYVMTVSLVLFAYTFYFRQIKLRLYHFLLVVALMFIVSAFIGSLRSGQKLSDKEGWVTEFIDEQGIGLQIIGHSIEHADEIDFSFQNMFAHTLTRLDVIMSRIQGDVKEKSKLFLMEKYKTLSFQLTYYVNKQAIASGWDMACSYIAELYLIGRVWGVLFGNIIVGFFTCYISRKSVRNKYGILFLLFFLPAWLFIPRDNLFDFITDNMTNVLFVSFILAVVYLYQYGNRMYRSMIPR